MQTPRIKNIISILLAGGFIFLFTGCIREDSSSCEEPESLTLKFRYVTSPESRANSNFPEIDRLSVFVFDESGVFVWHTSDSLVHITDAYSMPLPLNPGCYQIVVWAGLDKHYILPDCIAGKTRIEDFTLRLEHEDNNIVPYQPALLYHGMKEKIVFKPAESQTVTIGLWRMTNTIRVIAKYPGLTSGHEISIEDDNGLYYYNGEIAPDDVLTYIPVYLTTNLPVKLTADFNVMRLQAGHNARLKIKDASGTILYNEALIEKLINAHPDINLDYNHDFLIEITFGNGYIPISIKINDWEIIEEAGGLG